MAVNECVLVAGLRPFTEIQGQETRKYWGHFSSHPSKFTVLARERDGVITFYAKSWTLGRPMPQPSDPVREKMSPNGAANLQCRMDQQRNRLERLEKKMDAATMVARTRRDILSQRIDTTMSKVLHVVAEVNKIKEDQRIDHHRLNSVVKENCALEDKVAGLSQKVHDAGRILNNPPIRKTPCGPTPFDWPTFGGTFG